MAATSVRSEQIGDEQVRRQDLNTTLSGSAVIAKAVAGDGVELDSTGVDVGTGDVTFAVPGHVPTGGVMQWLFAAAPSGWVVADGSALTSSAANDPLRTLLASAGYPYGQSGSNPLLPDLRGRVVVTAGAGPSLTARSIGDTGGAEDHTLTVDEMPTHRHKITAESTGSGGTYIATDAYLGTDATQASQNYNAGPTDAELADDALTETGGGQEHNNMQPYLVLNTIIKL